MTSLQLSLQQAIQQIATDARNAVHREAAELAIMQLKLMNMDTVTSLPLFCLNSVEIMRPFLLSLHLSNFNLCSHSLSSLLLIFSTYEPNFQEEPTAFLSVLFVRCIHLVHFLPDTLADESFHNRLVQVCGTLGVKTRSVPILRLILSLLIRILSIKSFKISSSALQTIKYLLSFIFDPLNNFDCSLLKSIVSDFCNIARDLPVEWLVKDEVALTLDSTALTLTQFLTPSCFVPFHAISFIEATIIHSKTFKKFTELFKCLSDNICAIVIHTFRGKTSHALLVSLLRVVSVFLQEYVASLPTECLLLLSVTKSLLGPLHSCAQVSAVIAALRPVYANSDQLSLIISTFTHQNSQDFSVITEIIRLISDISCYLFSINTSPSVISESLPSALDPFTDPGIIRPSLALFLAQSFLIDCVESLAVVASKSGKTPVLRQVFAIISNFIFDSFIVGINIKSITEPLVLAVKSLLHTSVVLEVEEIRRKCLNVLIGTAEKGSLLAGHAVFSCAKFLCPLMSSASYMVEWRNLIKFVVAINQNSIESLTVDDSIKSEAINFLDNVACLHASVLPAALAAFATELPNDQVSSLCLVGAKLIGDPLKLAVSWVALKPVLHNCLEILPQMNSTVRSKILDDIFHFLGSLLSSSSSDQSNLIDSSQDIFHSKLPTNHFLPLSTVFLSSTTSLDNSSMDSYPTFLDFMDQLSSRFPELKEIIVSDKEIRSTVLLSLFYNLFTNEIINSVAGSFINFIEKFGQDVLPCLPYLLFLCNQCVEVNPHTVENLEEIRLIITSISDHVDFKFFEFKHFELYLSAIKSICFAPSKSDRSRSALLSVVLHCSTLIMGLGEFLLSDNISVENLKLFFTILTDLCIDSEIEVCSSLTSVLFSLISSNTFVLISFWIDLLFPCIFSLLNNYSKKLGDNVDKNVYEGLVKNLALGLVSLFGKYLEIWCVEFKTHPEILENFTTKIVLFFDSNIRYPSDSLFKTLTKSLTDILCVFDSDSVSNSGSLFSSLFNSLLNFSAFLSNSSRTSSVSMRLSFMLESCFLLLSTKVNDFSSESLQLFVQILGVKFSDSMPVLSVQQNIFQYFKLFSENINVAFKCDESFKLISIFDSLFGKTNEIVEKLRKNPQAPVLLNFNIFVEIFKILPIIMKNTLEPSVTLFINCFKILSQNFTTFKNTPIWPVYVEVFSNICNLLKNQETTLDLWRIITEILASLLIQKTVPLEVSESELHLPFLLSSSLYPLAPSKVQHHLLSLLEESVLHVHGLGSRPGYCPLPLVLSCLSVLISLLNTGNDVEICLLNCLEKLFTGFISDELRKGKLPPKRDVSTAVCSALSYLNELDFNSNLNIFRKLYSQIILLVESNISEVRKATMNILKKYSNLIINCSVDL
ncbi:hypothetical protein RCL1_006272 [Eukaryota sp. TZLM3-RCL]